MDYSSDYVTPVHIVNLAISFAASYVAIEASKKIIEEYPGNIILGFIWPGITMIWFFIDRFFKSNIISRIKNRAWKNLWRCLMNFVTINLAIVCFNYWLDIVKRISGLSTIPTYNLFVIMVMGITFLFYVFQDVYMKKRRDLLFTKKVLEMLLRTSDCSAIVIPQRTKESLKTLKETIKTIKEDENKSEGVIKKFH